MLSKLTLTTSGTATGGSGCGCGCGGNPTPTLRVTDIPKSIRHGAVIGGLLSLATGDSIILTAPHDPKPILAKIAETAPEGFQVTYLTSGPDEWQLELIRR